MAEFKLSCPYCNAKLAAEEDWIGFRTLCPNCKKYFTIEQKQETFVPLTENSDATENNNSEKESESSKQNILVDYEEDGNVINSLILWKNAIVMLAAVGFFVFLIACIVAMSNKNEEWAFLFFICCVFHIVFCSFWHLLVCWMRGTYRNLVWNRIIAQNMQISKMQFSKNLKLRKATSCEKGFSVSHDRHSDRTSSSID